jgi:hypothetical protein
MNLYDWWYTYKFVCGNSHVSFLSINDGALLGLLHQHHLPKVLTFLFGGWSEEVRWNKNSYDWLTAYKFVYGNSHVLIRSINDGALFGGRREETHEDANKIQIRMIDWPHANLYVVTHMFSFVASTTAPYLDFFINITCQRFSPSYLEAEARKWDEIRIRMIDWIHTNLYEITYMCQFVASMTAPYLEADKTRHERMLMKYEFVWLIYYKQIYMW